MNDAFPGCSAEVVADFDSGKVMTRFLHPQTEEMLVELYLDPETAREYALNLTRASIAIETGDTDY